MSTQVGIVYSTGTHMLRYIIIPEFDSQLTDGTFRISPGESRFQVSRALYNNIGPAACLALHFGVAVNQLPNPRCAVLDVQANVVTNVIQADQTVDVPPNAITTRYINDPNAQIGWTLVNGVLTPPAQAVPQNDLPPIGGRAQINMQAWAPETYTQTPR